MSAAPEGDEAGPAADEVGLPRGYLLRALLRPLGTATALVVLYFVLPLDGHRDASALVLLGLGLAVFGVLAGWQVLAVLRAPHPALRAVRALAMAVPLYLLLFATAYVLMSAEEPASFSEGLDRLDALYFTVTVFATVGFGDIAPVTQAARAVVLGQMVANLVVLGLLLRLVTRAVEVNRTRRSTGGPR